MKKVYALLSLLLGAGASFAQTIDNAGFETWRHTSAGAIPVSIHAPSAWYGFDSVIILGEETYLPIFFGGYTPTDLNAQVFQETTIVHSGTSAAKLISRKQDTLGHLAGSISNAQPSLDPVALAGGDIANAIIYTGGTSTNLRITDATAWIEYFPGKDSITGLFGGNDSGTFVVQSFADVGGTEVMVGSGTVNVGPLSSYTSKTVTVNYTDLVNPVNLVRIFFGSGNIFNTLDSSIIYVDDVSMNGVPQVGVNDVNGNNSVKAFPNPAANTFYVAGVRGNGLTCALISVTGQVVANKAIASNGGVDVSSLPAGIYTYIVSDEQGAKLQAGKVSVTH